MKILVTGGAGFIGSCFIRLALRTECGFEILNLDKLTYAGNLENLAGFDDRPDYRFVHGDIADTRVVEQCFSDFAPDAVVHFAAESHVDRSILSPEPVFETNLRGTFTLLEAARRFRTPRFVHISTDEVYGSIPGAHEATEDYPLRASSPYSAAKAGSDLLTLSYWTTYTLPVVVTRASNNYGPYQFPEKLIPLMIANALEGKPLPVYGDGMQVRDWLFVEDHCEAILAVLAKGRDGEVYNIGGSRSLPNIEVVRKILEATGRPETLIRYVSDRPGHDRRYALSSAKIMSETGWSPQVEFERGLSLTISWYREHAEWVRRVTTGEYRRYYADNYEHRAVIG